MEYKVYLCYKKWDAVSWIRSCARKNNCTASSKRKILQNYEKLFARYISPDSKIIVSASSRLML